MRASPGGGLRLGRPRPGRPGPWLPFDTYKRPKRDETEWQRLAMQSVATNCTLKRNGCLYLCRVVATDSAGCSATLISTRKGRSAAFLHAGSIAAAFLHADSIAAALLRAGSIAAALLRAARALSVQKRYANERDV